MGIMIEHFAGTFPLWIAPVQATVIPVGEAFMGYADEVYRKLKSAGIRVSIDDSNDGLNKKVRNAETAHINYILVVGEQEMNSGSLAVRNYKTKEQTTERVTDFIERAQMEIENKTL